jgi:hypothetical protein
MNNLINSTTRMVIRHNIEEHKFDPVSLFETETGHQRYGLAKAQYDLEIRCKSIWKSILALTAIKEYSEMYKLEYWRNWEKLDNLYLELQALDYEKTPQEMLCPLMEIV